jgi:hypothetical protein
MKNRKENLPEKLCKTCGKPFTWRKKWERDWEQVLYCSERCRRNKGACLTLTIDVPIGIFIAVVS